MRTLLTATAALACAALAPGQDPAPLKVGPHKLVRLKVEKTDPDALVLWRVSPSKDVDRATTPDHIFEFVAPPGTYTVERLTFKVQDKRPVLVEEWKQTIDVEKCCDKVPPVITPPPPKDKEPVPPPARPKADPWNALGRIQFGNAGCTATVVWPRRADGRWDVLTAEHCVDSVPVGSKGQMQLRGQTARIGVTLVLREARSDVAWLVTDSADLPDLPFAVLADKTPPVGTKVWHGGWGVHVPGNREDGEVLAGPNTENQVQYHLSVSSGDSGGGIFNDATGELLSPVCCTTQKNVKARVWGGSPERAAQLRPRPRAAEENADDWFRPVAIPERRLDAQNADWWKPIDIPERGPAGMELAPRERK